MNNDDLVVEWLKRQMQEDALNDIFIEIDSYSSWIKEDEKLLEYTKAIRQDLHKIFWSIDRIYATEKIAKEKSEVGCFFRGNITEPRKTCYQGVDLEYIFVKYRSILDYCVELIKKYFPEVEKFKLEGKYQYFNDILKGEPKLNKEILSSTWYQHIKEIRDNIIHHGATCVVFDCEELGFQIYDLSTNNLYQDEQFYKINNNVYKVDMFLLVYLAYLYYFLDRLFKSIIKKSDKKFSEEGKEIKKEEMINHIEYCKKHLFIRFVIPSINILEDWINRWDETRNK